METTQENKMGEQMADEAINLLEEAEYYTRMIDPELPWDVKENMEYVEKAESMLAKLRKMLGIKREMIEA
jgi:tRNA U54 and U55 pseudouridine synthase Pus10